MGMSSIPIDTQTVVSEDFDDAERHANDTNLNPNHNTNPTNNTATATTTNALHPRIALNLDELHPDDHDPEGRNSPPAYTPRTADGSHQPDPPLPSYTTALSVNELRVGAPGLVTRKLPRTRENIWV